ncbi:hypothetical protein TRICI_005397 [Trichomonascus ciferrii]|uniref:Uncharacterized protein n=1 Tax=Trichomonascus ciferrii TaxID=44093 RepID=A0A642UST0_9ASCO|nr:hypothetical protein TRICI_005397 [Trichomonascus ciferrii]
MESFLQDPVADDVIMKEGDAPVAKSEDVKMEAGSNGVENGEPDPTESLHQLDILPMVLELLDKVAKGQISAKDVHNEVRNF